MGDWRQCTLPVTDSPTWPTSTCHLNNLLLARAGQQRAFVRCNNTGNLPVAMTTHKHATRRRNPWGNISYADLIATAIDSAPDKRLTLSQIYDWIVLNVPYFRDKADSSSAAGWKNSIRHNLSLHSRFVRVLGDGAGKCSWWTVNGADAKAAARRRRCESALMLRPPVRLAAKLNMPSKDTSKNCAYSQLWRNSLLQSPTHAHSLASHSTTNIDSRYLPGTLTPDARCRSRNDCTYWSQISQFYNPADSNLSKLVMGDDLGSRSVEFSSATMTSSQLVSPPLALRRSVEYSASLTRVLSSDMCSLKQQHLNDNVTKSLPVPTGHSAHTSNQYNDQYMDKCPLGAASTSLLAAYNSSLICNSLLGAAVPASLQSPMYSNNGDAPHCTWMQGLEVVPPIENKLPNRPRLSQVDLLLSQQMVSRPGQCDGDLDVTLGELQVAGLECDVGRILCDGNFDTTIDL